MPTILEIKELASEHLEEAGVVGDWIMCLCPYHQDHNPSFGISLLPKHRNNRHYKAGGFNCFTCGASGSWEELLKHLGIEQGEKVDAMSEGDWDEVKYKLMGTEEEPIVWPGEDVEIESIMPKQYSEPEEERLFDLKVVINTYLAVDRKLDIETVKKFSIGCSDHHPNFLFIPVKAPNGEVLWLERRRIKGEGSKYWRPKGVRKELVLFNFNAFWSNHKNTDWVCLTEGIFDAIRLDQCKVPAICCFGSFSVFQRNLILSRFNRVYVIFDGDKAGKEKAKEVKDILKDSGVSVFGFNLPSGKDPADLAEVIADRLGRIEKLLG